MTYRKPSIVFILQLLCVLVLAALLPGGVLDMCHRVWLTTSAWQAFYIFWGVWVLVYSIVLQGVLQNHRDSLRASIVCALGCLGILSVAIQGFIEVESFGLLPTILHYRLAVLGLILAVGSITFAYQRLACLAIQDSACANEHLLIHKRYPVLLALYCLWAMIRSC